MVLPEMPFANSSNLIKLLLASFQLASLNCTNEVAAINFKFALYYSKF